MSGYGRYPPPPPPHRSTSSLSSIVGKAAGKKSKDPHVQLREVFIPVYELNWETLKAWINNRYSTYNRNFADKCIISGDQYVVCLPEDLTEDDKNDIADLKDY